MIHILSYKKLPFRYYDIQKRSFFHYYFIKGARLSNCPLSALFGRSGSAILWRPKAIRSARPCFTRSSAYCGSVKRPTAITGTETARLISVTRSPLKPPWTRPGAHINSSWRCTTRVTWRAFTPHSCSRYAATAAASCTLCPPSKKCTRKQCPDLVESSLLHKFHGFCDIILSKEEDTMKPDIEKLRKNTWITHQKECLPGTFAAWARKNFNSREHRRRSFL